MVQGTVANAVEAVGSSLQTATTATAMTNVAITII